MFLFPSLRQAKVTEVDYGTFLRQVEAGEVKKVEIQELQIVFTIEENGEEKLYVTGKIDDPGLVERLHASGAEFKRVIPKEMSPLLDFLLSWLVPIGIFVLLGRFITSRFKKPWAQYHVFSAECRSMCMRISKTLLMWPARTRPKALEEIVDFA